MYGLDYLVKDFQYLLDLIIESVETRAIYEHAKFNVLFELAHSLNNLLESFRSRYISKMFNEKWKTSCQSTNACIIMKFCSCKFIFILVFHFGDIQQSIKYLNEEMKCRKLLNYLICFFWSLEKIRLNILS